MINSVQSGKVRQIEKDLFLKRLPASVIGEGMLHAGNQYWFDYVVKRIPNHAKVLEIGSYAGLSAITFMHLCKLNNKEIIFYNCDPWIYEGYRDHKEGYSEHIDGRNDVSRSDYGDYIKQAFVNSMYLFEKGNLPYSFRMYSNDFFSQWNKKSKLTDLFDREVVVGDTFDYIYIDGDHSYEMAMSDLNNALSCLNKGGFILLDDSADHLPFGSAKMMAEVKKMKGIEIVGKNPNYLLKKL